MREKTVRDSIHQVSFSELDFNDGFFNSLRESYNPGFAAWFKRKAESDEKAWVAKDENDKLVAMLYLKFEDDSDETTNPPLTKPRLKIGTFKVDFEHHTSLGKRLLAIALRTFAESGRPYVYVTMHDADNTKGLRAMLGQYGFVRIGTKDAEQIWAKRRVNSNAITPYETYPFVLRRGTGHHILSIYPKYHERMFPIRLRDEMDRPVRDNVASNTIEKIYLSGARNAPDMKPGDYVAIYRTKTMNAPALYSSVISSICTVTEIRDINSFERKDGFIDYVRGRSVFSLEELEDFWTRRKYRWVISMLFNFPLNRCPNRKSLIEKQIIRGDEQLTCIPISEHQFDSILDLGEADEGYIVD